MSISEKAILNILNTLSEDEKMDVLRLADEGKAKKCKELLMEYTGCDPITSLNAWEYVSTREPFRNLYINHQDVRIKIPKNIHRNLKYGDVEIVISEHKTPKIYKTASGKSYTRVIFQATIYNSDNTDFIHTGQCSDIIEKLFSDTPIRTDVDYIVKTWKMLHLKDSSLYTDDIYDNFKVIIGNINYVALNMDILVAKEKEALNEKPEWFDIAKEIFVENSGNYFSFTDYQAKQLSRISIAMAKTFMDMVKEEIKEDKQIK